MIDQAAIITSFVTLLVIIDPFGLTPMFVALTQGMDPAKRRAIALRSCLTAAFLLAIPLIAGPGSIASIILLAGQQPDTDGLILVIGVMLAVMAVVLVLFLSAGIIERILGKTGINVVTRLLGMLLAALSVQFILDGLRDFGFAA